MFQIDSSSKVPVYLQIVHDYRHKIMTSKMHAHEKLPSVRALARELGINPNTVQKAYAVLRKEELVYSIAGKGEYVAENMAKIKEMKRDRLIEIFVTATKEARDSGMWIDEIFTIIDEAYTDM